MTIPEANLILLRRASEAVPEWLNALTSSPVPSVEPATPVKQLRSSLSNATCILVDGGVNDVTDRIRRAHEADAAVQAVVVAPSSDHPRLTRAMLFAPGIGEVWLRSPEELNPALIRQAGDLTRTRRGYRRTARRIRQGLAIRGASHDQRAIISDAYLAALLDAVPDPVISVDDAGVVQSWNPGAERVLGYERSEALGRPLTEVMLATPADAAVLDENVSPPGELTRREIRFRRKNGDIGIGELIVSTVEAGGQRIQAVVLHDLTAERRAQAEIQAKSVALEHAARTRDRFYASMSHELRTPINAILGFLDLVLAGVYGPLGEKQEEGLVRARRAGRHLHELVNDVLDLARIEAGRMELAVEVTPFPVVIWEVLETLRAMADQAGSELSIHGPEYLQIRTDPRRLRQILLNLLSNAIKFGQGLPIQVRWAARKGEGVRIEVVDQGVGIPPEEMDRIFDEFTVGSEPGAGTGLGLAISHHLARLLGGSLEAFSSHGRGSVFRIDLPDLDPEVGRGDGRVEAPQS